MTERELKKAFLDAGLTGDPQQVEVARQAWIAGRLANDAVRREKACAASKAYYRANRGRRKAWLDANKERQAEKRAGAWLDANSGDWVNS